jgi:hypothetical protein
MPDTTCAAPLCSNSIADRLAAWEERGRKGRKPKFCDDPMCVRTRKARNKRGERRPKRRGWWHHRAPVIEEGDEGFIRIRGPASADADVAELFAPSKDEDDPNDPRNPKWDDGGSGDKGQWDDIPERRSRRLILDWSTFGQRTYEQALKLGKAGNTEGFEKAMALLDAIEDRLDEFEARYPYFPPGTDLDAISSLLDEFEATNGGKEHSP